MTNKIQIGVDANVGGVDAALNKVEGSAADVAKSVGAIGQASDKAAAGLAKVEISAKRLQAVAATLSKEFGKAINPKQAEEFLRAFEAIRSNKKISGSSKLRGFDSFESWYAGNRSMFVDQAEAERYKRRVLGLAGQGLGAPVPAGGRGTHGGPTGSTAPGDHRSGFGYGAAASRGAGMVRGLAGPALALAGVTGIMAMAGRAVDLAKQEATSTDQLLRKTGDLTTSFDTLRDRVRASGDGLGVLYTEASQLGKQYVEIANGDGGDIGGNLRTGFGLSRAYGLELGQGVGFMAQARHFGQIGADDQNGRKFALLIAEAIERGQTRGKAGEVLTAVSSFSAQVARLALTPGNVAGFGGALAGLTSSSDYGLKGDPSNAAQLLMSVDNAIRNGGGMGEAGMNFTYGALSRAMPGLDPIMAKAVMEQGAFGSGVSPSIRRYAQRNGIGLPAFAQSDNLSLVMDEFDRQYGNSSLKLDAMKNYFGLNSYGQAAALANLDRRQLTGLRGAMGNDISSLSASGIQGAARISVASDDELKKIAGKLGERTDLTTNERNQIKAKLADGDMDGLREVMLKAVAVREQEKNVGTETRDAVNALHNTLTDIGGVVLPAITAIQEGVVAMARVLAPQSDVARQQELKEGAAEYQNRKADLLARQERERQTQLSNANKRNVPPEMRAQYEKMLAEQHKAELEAFERSNSDFEEYLKKSSEDPVVQGMRERDRLLRERGGPVDLGAGPAPTPGESRGARVGPVNIKPEEMAILERATAGDADALDFLKTALAVENRGFGELRHNAVSPKGAYGAFQIMPGTARGLGIGERAGFEEQAMGAKRLYDELYRTYGGNTAAMLAHYNGGHAAGRAVMNGMQPSSQETRDYLGLAGQYRAQQRALPTDALTAPLPAGNPAGNPVPTAKLELKLDGHLRDSMHQQVADLLPIQQTINFPTAAGAST